MIHHSSNTIVRGPSKCGKFTWTRAFLRHDDVLIHPPPRAKHCYRAWKPAFDEMKKKMDVTFHKGLPRTEDLERWFGPSQGGLLVLDDLMDEEANDKRLLDLLSKQSHDRNISVMFLCQDLFFLVNLPRPSFQKLPGSGGHADVGPSGFCGRLVARVEHRSGMYPASLWIFNAGLASCLRRSVPPLPQRVTGGPMNERDESTLHPLLQGLLRRPGLQPIDSGECPGAKKSPAR